MATLSCRASPSRSILLVPMAEQVEEQVEQHVEEKLEEEEAAGIRSLEEVLLESL